MYSAANDPDTADDPKTTNDLWGGKRSSWKQGTAWKYWQEKSKTEKFRNNQWHGTF